MLKRKFATIVLTVMVLAIALPIWQLFVTQEAFAEANEVEQTEKVLLDKSAINSGYSCSMHNTESSAKSDIETVVTHRSKYKSNYKISFNNSIVSDAKNLSQRTLNNYYNARYSDQVSGTCSLVAMTMLAEAVKTYRPYVINKSYQDIFVDFRNAYAYVSGQSTYNGGQRRYYEATLERFYAQNGIYADASLITISSGVNENGCDNICPLSILSFSGADVTYTDNSFYDDEGHSVLFVGCYVYKTSYKEKYLGIFTKSVTKTFEAYVVCDGWTYSSAGTIGNNYQMVVFNDSASIATTQIPDMIPNIWAEM